MYLQSARRRRCQLWTAHGLAQTRQQATGRYFQDKQSKSSYLPLSRSDIRFCHLCAQMSATGEVVDPNCAEDGEILHRFADKYGQPVQWVEWTFVSARPGPLTFRSFVQWFNHLQPSACC